MSHSASTQNNSHWPSVRAPVRLILIESGCWSKEQTFIVAACGDRCLSQKDAFRKVEWSSGPSNVGASARFASPDWEIAGRLPSEYLPTSGWLGASCCARLPGKRLRGLQAMPPPSVPCFATRCLSTWPNAQGSRHSCACPALRAALRCRNGGAERPHDMLPYSCMAAQRFRHRALYIEYSTQIRRSRVPHGLTDRTVGAGTECICWHRYPVYCTEAGG